MKKLSLKNLKLDTLDVLQRNQLKTVFGGEGGYGEIDKCCVKIPGQNPPPGCNPNYECRHSTCYCF